MRKYLLVLAIGFFTLNSYSQSFNGGIEAGFMYSWLGTNSKNADSDGGKMGFNYGVYLDKNLSENFSTSVGINVLGMGGTLKYKNANSDLMLKTQEGNYTLLNQDAKINYSIRYLELPVSVKGKTREIGYITYFGKVGLSPMFAVKSRADIENTSVVDDKGVALTGDDIKDLNISKDINLFTVGYHIGAGAEYSLGGTTAIIGELIYMNTLTDMTNDNSSNKVHVTSNVFLLKVGIKF